MNKTLIVILLMWFVTSPSEVWAQDSLAVREVHYDLEDKVVPISLDENTLKELKEQDDFDYTEKKEEKTWWESFKEWLWNIWVSFWRWLLGDYEASPFWSFVVGMLPYLIIAGIIGFIIWLIIKLNPGMSLLNTREAPQVFLTEEEEIIKSKNIRELIQQALQENNYRLAVRYYYLLALKNLSEAHIITYEFDKTNHDYAREIKTPMLNVAFQKVTTLYDYIWYGNFEVDHTDFQKAQRSFEKLENQIPQS